MRLAILRFQTMHAFGIHNKGGLPHPCTYLIDQQGVVHAKLAEDQTQEPIEAAQRVE